MGPRLIAAVQRIAWHVPQWRRRGAARGGRNRRSRRRDLLDAPLREPAVMIFWAGPWLPKAPIKAVENVGKSGKIWENGGKNVNLLWFSWENEIFTSWCKTTSIQLALLSSFFCQTCDACDIGHPNWMIRGLAKFWMVLGRIPSLHAVPDTHC